MSTISRVERSELSELVEIAIAAFLDDDQYKPFGAEVQGPPGHDLLSTHEEWHRDSIYLKLIKDGDIAAGCSYEVADSKGEICALFVHPDFMNKGIGSELLHTVLAMEPNVTEWELETPDYAKRNHSFYLKNGFQIASIKPKDPEIGFGFYTFKLQNSQSHQSNSREIPS